MKTGDQVMLFVTERGHERRLVTKELLVDDAGVVAITTAEVDQGWPEKPFRLLPHRIELSPTTSGPVALYVYQEDVIRP